MFSLKKYRYPCCFSIILVGKKSLNKYYLIGDGAVGLTCLLQAYMKKKFPSGNNPTIIDSFRITIKINKKIVNIDIYDTAGQRDFVDIRCAIYKGREPKRTIVFYCYSADNKDSLDNIESFWYPEVNSVSNDFLQVLVRLKEDKFDQTLVTPNDHGGHVEVENGDELMKKLNLAEHLSCDALTYCNTSGEKGNVEKVFQQTFSLLFKRFNKFKHYKEECYNCATKKEEDNKSEEKRQFNNDQAEDEKDKNPDRKSVPRLPYYAAI